MHTRLPVLGPVALHQPRRDRGQTPDRSFSSMVALPLKSGLEPPPHPHASDSPQKARELDILDVSTAFAHVDPE